MSKRYVSVDNFVNCMNEGNLVFLRFLQTFYNFN